MAVTITLTAGLLLSDDGGDYRDETPATHRQAEVKARERRAHYLRAGHRVNFDNQKGGGQIKVTTGTDEAANARR